METLALTRTAVNPISPMPSGDVPRNALIKSKEYRRVNKKPIPRQKNTTKILPPRVYGNSFFRFFRLDDSIVNPKYAPRKVEPFYCEHCRDYCQYKKEALKNGQKEKK